MSALIEFEEVCKYYQMGDTTVKAADHITMKIDKGEFVAIVGQSGSGKSTCMNIIGCLDVPTEGTYLLDGRDVGRGGRPGGGGREDAVAAEECEVLFVNISAFSGGAPGTVHEKLLRNLLTVSMRKNLSLSQRIFCTTPKTVRGRLLTYFSAQAARSGSLQFEIPFNRQQLADYLNLDRSALSKELCKMRDEGLLEFDKNRFVLKQLPE